MPPASVPSDSEPTAPLRHLSSSRRKLVYLYLLVEGEATVDQLKADLDLDLLTLYNLLPVLRDAGVVDNDGDRWYLRR